MFVMPLIGLCTICGPPSFGVWWWGRRFLSKLRRQTLASQMADWGTVEDHKMDKGWFDWYAKSDVHAAVPPMKTSGCTGAVLGNWGNGHCRVGDSGCGVEMWVWLSNWKITAVGDSRRDCWAAVFLRLQRRFSSSIVDCSYKCGPSGVWCTYHIKQGFGQSILYGRYKEVLGIA